MDIFAEADIRTPSRTAQQDEEEAAVSSSSTNLRPPVFVWNHALRQSSTKGLECAVLVVGTCPASCALISSLQNKQVLGTVLAPGVSLAGCCLEPQPSDNTCVLYSLEGVPGVVLMACQYRLPAERTGAWARSVLQHVQPQHTIVLGAIPAEQYCGQGDASQDALVFALRTRAAAAAQATGGWPAPQLPTGTVFSGPAAALLSHAQVRGLSCEALVAIEMGPDARVALLDTLAASLAASLGGHQQAALSGVVGGAQCRAAARRVLGAAAGAASNVYI